MPAVYRELCDALEAEEPKLMSMVKKPKKGLSFISLLLDRKLKKYCKRIDDKVNLVHQKLAPLRPKRGPRENVPRTREPVPQIVAPPPTSARASQATTSSAHPSTPRAKDSLNETTQTSPAAATAAAATATTTEWEASPLEERDGLLYSRQGRPEEESPRPRQERAGADRRREVAGREALGDLSNKGRRSEAAMAPGPASPAKERRAQAAPRPPPRAVEEKDRGVFGKNANAIAVLLSSCDFLEEDLRGEPYLTYDAFEMVLSAGELVSKGWEDPHLLRQARELFRMAALEGSIVAARCLGLFHVTGICGGGDGPDEAQARKWFQLGASARDRASCFLLGEMEEFGRGGAADAGRTAANYESFRALAGESAAKGGGAAALAILAILEREGHPKQGDHFGARAEASAVP